MLVINRELFVGLESLARVSLHAFPHRARLLEVAVALRHPRQRSPRESIRLGRQQIAFDGLRVMFLRTLRLASALANPRHAKKLQRVLPVRFRLGQQSENPARKPASPRKSIWLCWKISTIGSGDRPVKNRNKIAESSADHVRAAMESQYVLFELREPHGPQPNPPQIARRMQKIEMRPQLGHFDLARHAVARFEQRPIERFAVERHQHAALGDPLR